MHVSSAWFYEPDKASRDSAICNFQVASICAISKIHSLGSARAFYSNWIENSALTQWTPFSPWLFQINSRNQFEDDFCESALTLGYWNWVPNYSIMRICRMLNFPVLNQKTDLPKQHVTPLSSMFVVNAWKFKLLLLKIFLFCHLAGLPKGNWSASRWVWKSKLLFSTSSNHQQTLFSWFMLCCSGAKILIIKCVANISLPSFSRAHFYFQYLEKSDSFELNSLCVSQEALKIMNMLSR